MKLVILILVLTCSLALKLRSKSQDAFTPFCSQWLNVYDEVKCWDCTYTLVEYSGKPYYYWETEAEQKYCVAALDVPQPCYEVFVDWMEEELTEMILCS